MLRFIEVTAIHNKKAGETFLIREDCIDSVRPAVSQEGRAILSLTFPTEVSNDANGWNEVMVTASYYQVKCMLEGMGNAN